MKRELRSKLITFRATEEEHAAIQKIVADENVTAVALIREGLALVIGKRLDRTRGKTK